MPRERERNCQHGAGGWREGSDAPVLPNIGQREKASQEGAGHYATLGASVPPGMPKLKGAWRDPKKKKPKQKKGAGGMPPVGGKGGKTQNAGKSGGKGPKSKRGLAPLKE